MKKKVLLLFFCILFFALSSDAAAVPVAAMTEEEALIASFASTGAEVMESTISCWSKLNDRFLGISQVSAEINRIVELMKLDKVTTVKNVESSDRLNKVVLYGTKGSKSYSIALESVKKDYGGETYIVFDVSMDRSYKFLKSERDFIAALLPKDAASVNCSSCIIGTYMGKLTEGEIEKKTRTALQAINARKVEGVETDELLSISAFSNSVDSFVLSRQQRVNIQVAVRFSPYDNKTYIWIGTPLIPMEY